MKIAFHSNNLGERGTEVSLFDYAWFNEAVLGNQSLIISDKNSNLFALNRFKEKFEVFLYDRFNEVDTFLKGENVDLFYAQKYGLVDGIVSNISRTAVHCVFDANHPHGDVYACISDWLAAQSTGTVPVVPYIVHLPDLDGDLRMELNIPAGAVVFGRHGAWETFDIAFAHRAVQNIVKYRDDIYFVFMNTRPFTENEHPQIKYLPKTYDLDKKVAFINTCDAMLHARMQGETFGLAIAEFALRKKPIITCSRSPENAHLDMMGDKCIPYSDERGLYKILYNFDPIKARDKVCRVYREKYNPEAVMKIFNAVFLT